MKNSTLVDKNKNDLVFFIEQTCIATKQTTKKKKLYNSRALRSLVALTFLSVYPYTSLYAKTESKTTARQNVTTDIVQLYQHTQQVEVPGVWVARNELTVSSPLQAIRIKKILVEEGDIVKAGQLLAELEDTSLKVNVFSTEGMLAQVKAKIGEIKVRKREAESLYSRSKKLKETNAISAQQLDELAASAQSFHHQLLAIEAEEKQVEQKLIEARSQLEKSQIRSPVDGIISQRYVHEGELVNLSQLFRLISHNQIEFEAMITQNLMAQLTQGMPVQVTKQQNELINGKVRLIGTSIQKETGIATIRIKPDSPVMVSAGTAGKAIFKFESSAKPAVDTRALRYEGISPYVFVVNDRQCVEMRPVQLGPRYINKVEVISGVAVNEEVVLSSSAFLQDGDCIGVDSSDIDEAADLYEDNSDNATTETNTSSVKEQEQEKVNDDDDSWYGAEDNTDDVNNAENQDNAAENDDEDW